MQEPFISSIEFRREPANTLVVSCSEGRIRRQVSEWLDSQGIEADMYVVPGGPLVLATGVETFQDSMLAHKRIKFLVEAHGIRRIMLLSHGSDCDDLACQCGMACEMWPHLSCSERITKQKDVLVQARQRLSSVLSIPIECWYADVVERMVQFEQIDNSG